MRHMEPESGEIQPDRAMPPLRDEPPFTQAPSPPRQRRVAVAAKAGKRWSRPVSRVLYALRRDSHSSRPGVAAWLQQPTREQRGPRYRSPIWSCSEWGLPCRTALAPYAVRSCRTLSPLPDPLAGPSAVCSLLHWPSARAAQALPGTLPCGARTFLDALIARRDCPADSGSHCNGRDSGLGSPDSEKRAGTSLTIHITPCAARR